jgi:hypothetical protein
MLNFKKKSFGPNVTNIGHFNTIKHKTECIAKYKFGRCEICNIQLRNQCPIKTTASMSMLNIIYLDDDGRGGNFDFEASISCVYNLRTKQ